mmetsp:Transcript_23028/g.38581  ORF Transcript_23028/g.38581 Transcript_23028/m.38581 type:complete len:608 (+) Transcript_23028:6873-8696(+)
MMPTQIFQLIAAWLFVCFIGVGLTYMNVQDAEEALNGDDHREYGKSSIMIKILLNAVQFNSIASSFDYQWPTFVYKFLEAQSSAGASFGTLLSTDCANLNINLRSFYINTIGIAFQPLITPVLAVFTVLIIFMMADNEEQEEGSPDGRDDNDDAKVHVGMMLTRSLAEVNQYEATFRAMATEVKSQSLRDVDVVSDDDPEVQAMIRKLRNRKYWSEFWTANLSLIFSIYPSLVLQTFQLFNCEQIGSLQESFVLLPDMNQRCYEGSHLVMVLAVGVPMFIGYVLGFPMLCLYILRSTRDDMRSRWTPDYEASLSLSERFFKLRNSMKVFLLFNGYRPSFYYWEITIMIRKILIVAIAVFIGFPQLQAVTATLLIVISLTLQLYYHPYDLDMCNNLEIYGLINSFVTYFFGQFLYLQVDIIVQFILSAIIVVCNCSFYSWAVYMVVREKYGEISLKRATVEDRKLSREKNCISAIARRSVISSRGEIKIGSKALASTGRASIEMAKLNHSKSDFKKLRSGRLLSSTRQWPAAAAYLAPLDNADNDDHGQLGFQQRNGERPRRGLGIIPLSRLRNTQTSRTSMMADSNRNELRNVLHEDDVLEKFEGLI